MARSSIFRELPGRLLVVVLLVLANGVARGGNTGKISGRVTDAKTKEAVLGVNVVVVGTVFGASTDVRGDFMIANVPPGTYTLRASQVGYANVAITNVVVKVDATTETDFRMEEAVVDIGSEVVITAQRPPVQKDNTASRVFIEKADIAARPTTVFTEVMNSLPSINVENGVMKVRGGTLNEVAFIIDGARARNPLNQDPYTNINLSSIQELEVITGSYNAEYGEARSGVFNIITKEGGEQYQAYADLRYTPPGVKHWGPSMYDYSTNTYWENTHARHLEWWIQYPDQWVDPKGVYGNDAHCSWTPEQAYANYMATHQPLSDYANIPGYSGEFSLAGPVPGINDLHFAASGKYQSVAPLVGNSYRKHGLFFDGTLKLSYKLDPNTKILFSGFYGNEETSWGIGGGVDNYFFRNYGLTARYAYYDYAGLPETQTDGQTLKLSHILGQNSMYEVKFSRVYAVRQLNVFPDDPLGWAPLSDPMRDDLRAGVTGGNANIIGYHTIGYQYRYNDKNTDWTLNGYYQNQVNKNWEVKSGLEFTYYNLDHFNQALFPARTDARTYNPYQGAAYFQNKLEFSGFIMNLGARFDFYNPNDVVYGNIFDPLNGPTEKTKTFSQLSPRLGISHPIDENTVLHFSYGHFFQRGSFGDYGEGTGGASGSLTTFIIDGTNTPWVLGNRDLRPEKTVAYEVGVERNFFDIFVLTVTGYYKDIRNTIKTTVIETPLGIYRTDGNGDYADVKGFEISVQKQVTKQSWGTTWGYLNFTTQVGITGRNGDATRISPTGSTYSPSGDYVVHNDPRLKAGIFYETPEDWDFLGGSLSRLSVSVDYQAVYPNDLLPQDYFRLNGINYLRPADQNTNLKIRKDFALFENRFKFGLYAEIHNLFNNKWVNFDAFENASQDEKQKFVDSGFSYTPSYDENGLPILDLSKYRNLPRSVVFGLTLEL